MAKEKTHMKFVETVRRMATADWGNSFENEEKAVADLSSKGIGVEAASLLEIVRKMEIVAHALAADERSAQRKQEWEECRKIPSNAKKFCGKNVGDFLYSCHELDDGVAKCAIAYVEGEYVRVAFLEGIFYRSGHYQGWATESYFESSAEALKFAALKDVEYHEPLLAYAKKVLAAIDANDDLSEFENGKEDDADENEE